MILQWKPFYYDFQTKIRLGAKYQSRFLKNYKLDIGANLHLYGPEMGGYVNISWSIISFNIRFGNPAKALDDAFGEGLGKIFKEGEEEMKGILDKAEKRREEEVEVEVEVESTAIPETSKAELKAANAQVVLLGVQLEEQKTQISKLTSQLALANKKIKENEVFVNLSSQLLEKKQNYAKEIYLKQGKDLTQNIENIIHNQLFSFIFIMPFGKL